MIRAIVWKELREQGLIAVVLAVLGSALLIAVAQFADPPSPGASPSDVVASLGAGRMLTLMLVVTAGMVCGGALFAAEKEAGTMLFLEALPVGRWAIWRAKLVAGLVLAALVVAVLLGVAIVLQIADIGFLVRLVIYALLAFAWGMLGSTLARTTLGSVGIAIPAAALAMFAILIPIVLLFSTTGTGTPRRTGWLIFEVLMLVIPLGISAWRFTALDRLRGAEIPEQVTSDSSTTGVKNSRPPGWGFYALVWLTLRQLRFTGLVLSAFALAFGLSMLLPDMRPLFFWPPLALMAGVLAGVTVFGDEQSHRTAIFWGEFRLPIRRAWWVKVGLHLALLAWLLFLVMLPCIIRAQILSQNRLAFGQTFLAAVFQTRLFDELGSQGWKYLLVPAVYGFAFGHLCGLLFRKLVVACGVAMMLGGVGAAAWGPSLMAGGVRHWQLWLPAAVVLLTGLFLMKPWATDRISMRSSLLRLAGGLSVAVLVLAVGLGYRVLQVPLEPDNADDIAFVDSLIINDENQGGREFRTAAERLVRLRVPVPEIVLPGVDARLTPIDQRADFVLTHGPRNENETQAFNDWLNALYDQAPESPDDKKWHERATLAAAEPVGVYDPPKLSTTTASTKVSLENAKRMAQIILLRGQQQQWQGNPNQFLPAFRTVLKLTQTIRRGGGCEAFLTAVDIEQLALRAAGRWLTQFHNDPTHKALIGELTRMLKDTDEKTPFDPRPYILADRYAIRETMKAPTQWLSQSLGHGSSTEQSEAEADLVSVAWTVPWELERTRRLVGMNESLRPDMRGYLTGRPGNTMFQGRMRQPEDMAEKDQYLRVRRRATLLKSAIQMYWSDHDKPPATQDELVSGGYLTELPGDPCNDDRPFYYRVSKGEMLSVSLPRGLPTSLPPERRPPEVFVKEGSAIIWSVGYDRKDDGGKTLMGGPRAEDLVDVIPEPPVPPR